MDEFLRTLLKTLNCIEVKGKDNVNYLLGCIMAVERMLAKVDAEESIPDESEAE